MKKFLFLGLLLFSFAAWAETIQLMVFGDSLSAGHGLDAKDSFGSQLNKVLLEDGYDIKISNYSRSGETSSGGVKKLKKALAQNPNAVVIELGINDALQKVPLEETTKNLQTIITTFADNGIPVFLVGMEAPTTLSDKYRNGFRQMYADLALENELLLYPFFMAGLWKDDGTHVSLDYFLADKVHPSVQGVSEIVRRIHPAIKQFLQEDVIATAEDEPKKDN